MSTEFSVGQMNKLGDALERDGFTPDEVTKLAQCDLKLVKGFLAGTHQIVPIEYVTIDCDAAPFCPDDWKVESHQKGGQFRYNPALVRLFLAEGQQNGQTMIGTELQKVLASQPVLNANVLDYLLAYPALIPEEWKWKWVFFWGTIYRDPGDRLYVRYLGWSGGRWGWHCFWLGGPWSGSCPAAIRAS